jgi:tetratricopeptide (TPR) repeat protein
VPKKISPRFISHVHNNLQYWLGKTEDLSDEECSNLASESQNIFRAVTIGLRIPECANLAIKVTIQAFKLVELNGYWREWIPVLEFAAANPMAAEQKVKLLNQLGFIYRLNGDIDRAIATHHDAAVLAEQKQDEAELARIHFNLGTDYRESRNYVAAKRHAHLASQMFAASGTSAARNKAALANLFGLIAHHQGNYKQALTHYWSAIPLWQESGNSIYLVRSLLNIGLALEQLKRFEEALQVYDQATQILDEAGLELDKVPIAINRGNIYFHMQQWRQAIEAYKSADSIHLHRSGNLSLQAMITTNLGVVFLELGDLVQAGTYLERAVSQWRDVGDKVMLGNAIATLGDTRTKQDKIGAARACFEEVLDLLEEFPDDGYAQEVRESCFQSLAEISQ